MSFKWAFSCSQHGMQHTYYVSLQSAVYDAALQWKTFLALILNFDGDQQHLNFNMRGHTQLIKPACISDYLIFLLVRFPVVRYSPPFCFLMTPLAAIPCIRFRDGPQPLEDRSFVVGLPPYTECVEGNIADVESGSFFLCIGLGKKVY